MKPRGGGLTLFELISVLAVAAVVLGIAVPTFNGLSLNASRRAAINNFVASAHFSRSTAIKRSLPVVICPGQPVHNCEPPMGWVDGWTVFVNRDDDHPPQIDKTDTVLRQTQPGRRTRVTSNRRFYRFNRIGRRSTNGTVVFCDRRGAANSRAVIISYTGRPRVSARAADGGPLRC